MIKVLIVDDSSVVRQTMSDILGSDPDIEIIAVAPDPYVAAKKIKNEIPDVITLDIEMPRMDGITFLRKIMSQHPIPVVICSSVAGGGSVNALRAMEYGAIDIIEKPTRGTQEFLKESRIIICDTVKAAARVKIRSVRAPHIIEKKLTADAVIEKLHRSKIIQTTEKIVVVGASTGGTEALRTLLEEMPQNSPGIVIVQHMPKNFTASFAERLDSICKVSVKEAKDNDAVVRGRALIAPGNMHTLLKKSGARYYVQVKEGPLVCRHRPSVDVLFRSAARYAGFNAVGVIMTGMGDDGANGMLEMKEVGAYNIAQDEATSVVFGMPQEAIKKGGVDKICPLENIAEEVLKQCST